MTFPSLKIEHRQGADKKLLSRAPARVIPALAAFQ